MIMPLAPINLSQQLDSQPQQIIMLWIKSNLPDKATYVPTPIDVDEE